VFSLGPLWLVFIDLKLPTQFRIEPEKNAQVKMSLLEVVTQRLF